MNDDTFNMEMRKFLKRVGVTSQRELENAVQQALSEGVLKGNETLKVKMTLTVEGLELHHIVDGDISLE